MSVDASRPSAREGVVVVFVGVALAIVMFWPLVLHLDRDVPKDLGDSLLSAYLIGWNGQAFLHQPFEWWQTNAFWPNPDSLAFSDAFIGYTPVALLGTGFRAAIWHYNVLFLSAYALSFAGAYLLARELGLGRPAAAVAGVAFAYSPWRWEQSAHVHVLSSGGIPLCLMLLLRGYRRERPAAVVAGWLVAAWQVSIGVSLAIQLLYLLAILSIGFALAFGVLVDAFLVRMTLVPAVLVLLDRRAWWLPGWMDRRIPNLDIEGEKILRELEPTAPAAAESGTAAQR